MLEALAVAVEELWPRADALIEAIALRERLDAKIAGALRPDARTRERGGPGSV